MYSIYESKTKQDLIDEEIKIADDIIFDVGDLWRKWLDCEDGIIGFRLSSDETNALIDYVNSSTSDFKSIDSAINKCFTTKDIYVQRVFTKDSAIKTFGEDVWENYQKNNYSEITEFITSVIKTPMSCSDYNSSYGNYASQFGKILMCYIFIPKGTNVAVFNTYYYPMGMKNEHEILLGTNHKLKINGMGSKNKILLCDLI